MTKTNAPHTRTLATQIKKNERKKPRRQTNDKQYNKKKRRAYTKHKYCQLHPQNGKTQWKCFQLKYTKVVPKEKEKTPQLCENINCHVYCAMSTATNCLRVFVFRIGKDISKICSFGSFVRYGVSVFVWFADAHTHVYTTCFLRNKARKNVLRWNIRLNSNGNSFRFDWHRNCRKKFVAPSYALQ